MKVFQREIKLEPYSRGFHLVTNAILKSIPELNKINIGILNVFIKHTSASLTINENADRTVREDFESHMNVQGARLGLLSSALIGKKALKMSGNGNLNMKLKSSGASPAALIHDLAGNGMVSGRNITINGIDVDRFARALSEDSKAGDSVMGLWSSANRGGKSHFDTLNGDFSIKEGVVHLNKMDLDGATTAIETRNGVINLPKWTLATKHKIIVKGIDDQPSDVPPFEISFKGSLDNPAQTFGQGLLQDYLNRKIQRKLGDIISKSLGKSSNDNSSPVSEKEESSQPKKGGDIEDIAEEAIRGVLDGLLR